MGGFFCGEETRSCQRSVDWGGRGGGGGALGEPPLIPSGPQGSVQGPDPLPPAGSQPRQVTLDWLAKFLGLPECFLSTAASRTGGGVIQGTASEACLVAMLAARGRMLRQRPGTPTSALVAYTTDQAHSCVKKACMIAGIEHLRLVPARAANGYALDPADLEAAMAEDEAGGLVPFFHTALIGTTSSAAVDPVSALAAVAAKRGAWCARGGGGFACALLGALAGDGGRAFPGFAMRVARGIQARPATLRAGVRRPVEARNFAGTTRAPPLTCRRTHVDMAYAGVFACLPDQRAQYFGGLDCVDSLSTNPHKGMLVTFDWCVRLVVAVWGLLNGRGQAHG